jgi:phenylalanyl-tRNA synthetase alpha chain
MHDTFFVTDPRLARTDDCPADYRERVKRMHEAGGDGSIGWRYLWSEEESRKNILRTHTTANSSRMLFAAAHAPGGFKPFKCFSIDRVFRNETLDATHLAEFHQVEGFIADYDIGLPHLIGTLTEFYTKLGMRDLRFKPAFNPYTEPSMEIFAYHPTLGRSIEIGNSGVFRPEMLGPMGLPPNVQVIAWGLSLERPTMIMYGINAIRSLFGPSCSLDFIRGSPLCVLDK